MTFSAILFLLFFNASFFCMESDSSKIVVTNKGRPLNVEVDFYLYPIEQFTNPEQQPYKDKDYFTYENGLFKWNLATATREYLNSPTSPEWKNTQLIEDITNKKQDTKNVSDKHLFYSLAGAIESIQELGFDYADFRVFGTDLTKEFAEFSRLKSEKLSLITRGFVQPFILSVICPHTKEYIKIALQVALANSRICDLHEGLYAIIQRFDLALAQKLSRGSQGDLTSTLLDQAAEFCVKKSPEEARSVLFEILGGLGNHRYLERLQNKFIMPDFLKGLPLGLVQGYAVAHLFLFLKQAWLTKRIPIAPTNTEFNNAHLFTVLLGTGLFFKNLMHYAYPLVTKKHHNTAKNPF